MSECFTLTQIFDFKFHHHNIWVLFLRILSWFCYGDVIWASRIDRFYNLQYWWKITPINDDTLGHLQASIINNVINHRRFVDQHPFVWIYHNMVACDQVKLSMICVRCSGLMCVVWYPGALRQYCIQHSQSKQWSHYGVITLLSEHYAIISWPSYANVNKTLSIEYPRIGASQQD